MFFIKTHKNIKSGWEKYINDSDVFRQLYIRWCHPQVEFYQLSLFIKPLNTRLYILHAYLKMINTYYG